MEPIERWSLFLFQYRERNRDFFSRVNSLMDVASKNLISFVFRLICTTFKEDEIFCFHYEETHISWFVVLLDQFACGSTSKLHFCKLL